MLRLIKYLVIILVLAIVALLGYASTRPDNFAITRKIAINAPPEKIFPLINNFTAWSKWSPWDKLDPALQRTFSGPPEGVGSQYAWKGNDSVGTGRMEITEAAPFSRIAVRLDFLSPMEISNMAIFLLTPSASGTDVEWTMTGKQPFASKVFGVLVDIDKMVGDDFDRGLSALKQEAEKP